MLFAFLEIILLNKGGLRVKILAVDDEKRSLDELKIAIREAAPTAQVEGFTRPWEALRFAEETPVDAVFLDIHMEEMSGLELAERLKELRPKTNIIFVTGYTEHLGAAFEMHASGYVKKPVRRARIEKELSHLRYPVEAANEPRLVRELGPYVFDHMARRVYRNGQDTYLKPKEFYLLCVFASAPGAFFSQEELFQRVWGDEPTGSIQTVYAHVSRLRIKLGMKEDHTYDIAAKRGVGYRLVTPQIE